jgi:NADPH2:quinone reductase
MTNGQGADAIFDPVGGRAFQKSMWCINWNGRILVIAFASDSKNWPMAPTNLLSLKGSAVIRIFWGRLTGEEPGRSNENFNQLFLWYEVGHLKPSIWYRFDLEDRAKVLTALIKRRVVGKCVVMLSRLKELLAVTKRCS